MTGPRDQITPRDMKVTEAYVRHGGNVLRTSKETGITRTTISKIVDRADIRELINDKMEKVGIGPVAIAETIKGALEAETTYVNKHGTEYTNIDHRTRLEAAKFYLRLQQVDMSGKAGEVTAEIHDVSDEDLVMIMQKTGFVDDPTEK